MPSPWRRALHASAVWLAPLLGTARALPASAHTGREDVSSPSFLSRYERGHQSSKGRGIPGMEVPHWGGQSFGSASLAWNPWAEHPVYHVLEDLLPTAPQDLVDKSRIDSITGAAPVLPGENVMNQAKRSQMMQPDWVPPLQHPKTFPWAGADNAESIAPGMIPIADRHIVAKPDRLRPYTRWETNPKNNYPLVAPINRMNPGPLPVAEEDRIGEKYGRYFEQMYNNEMQRTQALGLDKIFLRVDVNKDNSISAEEYQNEVEGRQGKTQQEAQLLWTRFQSHEGEDMSRTDFEDLAATGFDVGMVNRSDISLVLTPPAAANRGFWGSGTACPSGTFAKAAQLKVMPTTNTSDNTALNCLRLKCDDDSVIESAEGPDGTWTSWATCPEGQKIHAFRVRSQEYAQAQDNSGVTNIEFLCRTLSFNETTIMRFSDNTTDPAMHRLEGNTRAVVAQGPTAVDGGWSPEITCGQSGLVCAAQVRLEIGNGDEDDIGVTDLRLFCCAAPVDCTGVCPAPGTATVGGFVSADCQTCRDRQSAGSFM